jgi:AraC-like DNA-binding protein
MNKIIETIHENISEPDFNVERLAELTYISRASLLRKIKVLSGLTPVDFIRAIKIKKAAELIATGDYQIGEVSYLIGINSTSYFIKLFRKQFGVTPKEFVKQHKP